MKKIKFLSGISATLALAAVALATTFTSCEKEDFNVIVEPNPAKVYFNPTVIDAATNTNVTAQATITGTATLEGTPDVAAQDVTISAELNGVTGSVVVKVAAASAGETVTYAPVIFLDSDFDITATNEAVYVNSREQWGNASYSHAGKTWEENDTEYIISYEASWNLEGEAEMANSEIILPSASLNEKIAANKTIALEAVTGKETLKASAFSLYNAIYTIDTYKVVYNYTSKATGDVVATAEYLNPNYKVTVEAVEMAHPSHASHYVHGHGHGNGENAGGGISLAD